MMGQRRGRQGQFFYAFDLDKAVPPDHLVRQIDAVLDLNWVHKELAPYYSHTGRPSIDPVLMIRMLIVRFGSVRKTSRLLNTNGAGKNQFSRQEQRETGRKRPVAAHSGAAPRDVWGVLS